MDILIQQIVSGLATGGIYASLALALVMIYQATDVVNFAQGEMAMFSTDRKSTRLNSSHPSISYAVFCLKKKNKPNFAIAYDEEPTSIELDFIFTVGSR